MGIKQITGGRKAFINFTRKLLVEDYGSLLPKDIAIIEVLENIKPDNEVFDACFRLKEAGYTIALDDFQYSPEYDALIKIADKIKVDLSVSKEEEQLDYAKKFLPRNIRMLAERVETLDDFNRTKEMGYSYFQGYFFSRPVVLSTEQAPESKITRLQLLQEVNRPEYNLDRAETIIKHDPTLTMKLFRYINSAVFGLAREIHSIRQAMILLGEKNIRKWSTVLILSSITEDKPEELLRQAIVRGRFCELLARPARLAGQDQELFMTGMFSLLDSMMNQPMLSLLEGLPLSQEVRGTLLGGASPYLDILSLVTAFEAGDWSHIASMAEKFAINEEMLNDFQRQAFRWADELSPD